MLTYQTINIPGEVSLSLVYTAPETGPKGIVQIAHGTAT